MSMFIKSALAMLITVGFAGGAVYYGTNGSLGGTLDGSLNGRQSAGNEVDLRVPQKIETPEPSSEPAKTETTVKTVTTTETVEVAEPEKQSDIVPGSQPVPELEPMFDEPKIAEPKPESALNSDLVQIMPMLMEQVEKISTVEIKDQAYLDIVNFSVSQRQFKFADAAMQKIDQTELRDTARSQIAIGLALGGRADDAFEVIDAVEIDTLRDVMRLQVIEALIVPGKLPMGLVRQ